MGPATTKRVTRARQPLAASVAPSDITQSLSKMTEIFNNSQHVATADLALNQLKKLYKVTPHKEFDPQFRDCVKKLLQSKQTIYFKTSCDVLCKFLQYVSKISDEIKTRDPGAMSTENTAPTRRSRRGTRQSLASDTSTDTIATTANTTTTTSTRRTRATRGTKRKANDSDDELVMEFLPKNDATLQTDSASDEDSLVQNATCRTRKSTSSNCSMGIITDHDRIVSTCMDVADLYMTLQDEECRHNAVFFVCKFISHMETLDEVICERLKYTLSIRIRDKKPAIRAQAVLASRTFQDTKNIRDGFLYHFQRDPEAMVRKALLQIMDTKMFGYDFLIDSTQDNLESMRKAAFQRLSKVCPKDLNSQQLLRVIHNGLNERERQAAYNFKAHTLESWLSSLYDGVDLHKLLQSFDVLNHHDVVNRLLESIYERDLEDLQNNGTSTKLHQIVESFRDQWFTADNTCLPRMELLDENVITIWFSLVNFCKKNQAVIKPIKIRTIEPRRDDHNESIERMLDPQDKNDEVAELYESLTPDLVNLIDFLRRFVVHANNELQKNQSGSKWEFIYHQIMLFLPTYEVGDELERKTVQEVLGNILNENRLTGKISNFITPIIKCLYHLIYSTSSNLMITYISELINNVRSLLEDLITSTQTLPPPILSCSAVAKPTRSAKKVRIDPAVEKRQSQMIEQDNQNLEFKIAMIRVEVHELNDKLDECIKGKDFDGAKVVNNKISNLQAELTMLQNRRCSTATDMSHMSMIIETEPTGNDKLSSTMIGDTSMNESLSSVSGQNREEVKIFKHHTNELLKCLQMYYGCLQNVKISQVPQTMLNHLQHLTYECLDDWFKEDSTIRSLMVACNGLTALVDKSYAEQPTTILLLVGATYDPVSIEVRTMGFKSYVDVVCEHEDLEIPLDKIERFLKNSLRDFDKYTGQDLSKTDLEFVTAIIEGSAKLLYTKKLFSPDVLSHLILWWYHPETHSRLKQFIGVFLPTFVNDILQRHREDSWLEELLEETFICCIELLHNYSQSSKGSKIMSQSDMYSLISFLCNLVPVSIHQRVVSKVDERIDDLRECKTKERQDLLKYLEKSKNNLSAVC